MEECTIANKKIKIYGIAKGSGMIHPNMATTLAYVFTDAKLPNDILNKLLKKNISTTFNAITCDGDTSTNDMATIFATGKANNAQIKNINDNKIKNFDKALNRVLLNLAKRVVSDGEGSSKFVTINVKKCKSEIEAKQIAFSIANSPLVKTAIAGEDPNWGRIIMGIGKSGEVIDQKKLKIKIGNFVVAENGRISETYDEKKLKEYMQWGSIEIEINLKLGNDAFKCYTCDFTHDYIDINADYRN
jgi:glutamate N-acetyltransferase/amino-acid N-acetyltransferase